MIGHSLAPMIGQLLAPLLKQVNTRRKYKKDCGTSPFPKKREEEPHPPTPSSPKNNLQRNKSGRGETYGRGDGPFLPSPLSSRSSSSPSSPLHPKEPDTKRQETYSPKLQAGLQVLEAEPRPRKSQARVAIMFQGWPPDSPQERMGRRIYIMSTRNPRNSFKYGMIQKRDFGIRVIDIICQKRAVGVPFKAEKGRLNPVYARKTGVISHFCFGGIER